MGELGWGEDRQRWGRTRGCGRDRCRLGQSETLVVGTTVAKVKVEKRGEEGVPAERCSEGARWSLLQALEGSICQQPRLGHLTH